MRRAITTNAAFSRSLSFHLLNTTLLEPRPGRVNLFHVLVTTLATLFAVAFTVLISLG